MLANTRFSQYVLQDATTYVLTGTFCRFWVAGFLILGVFSAAATAQTVPITGDQHFTQNATFDLPVGSNDVMLTVNDTEVVDAEDGVELTFRVERAQQEQTLPHAVIVANAGGEIDLHNATLTIESYGGGDFGRVRYGVAVGGGNVLLGDNTVIRAEAQPYQGGAVAASLNGYLSIGDNAQLDGMVYGLYYGVVLSELGSVVEIGENALIRNTSTEYVADTSLTPRVAVMAMSNGNISIGDGSRIETFSPSKGAYGVRAGNLYDDGKITLGDNVTVVTRGESSYALLVDGTTSTLTTGRVDVLTSGKDAYTAYATRGGILTLADASTLHTTGELGFAIVSKVDSNVNAGSGLVITTEGYQGIAVFADNGTIEVEDNLRIVTTGDYANAIRATGTTASIIVGDNLTVDTQVGLGAYASLGGSVAIGDNATIDVDNYWAVNSSGAGSNITFGENLSVATKQNQANIVVASGGGTVQFQPNTTLSAAGDELVGIYASSGGRVTFSDLQLSVIPSEATIAIFANNGGASVEGGGVLDIAGRISVLDSNDTGASVNLIFGDGSKYTGATTVDGDNAILNMTFSGANTRWNMTGDSSLTDLELADGVRHTVPSGQTLDTQNTRIYGGAVMDLMGSLSAAETLAGGVGKTAGQLNIYGSEGTATMQNLGEEDSQLGSRFYIDSTQRGVKSLDVSGTASMDDILLDATVWGFAQLSSPEYTLVDNSDGGTRIGTPNITNDTLTAYEALQDADRVYLQFDADLVADSWDDMTHCYFFEGGSYQGMIEIISDTNYGLRVSFNNLTDDLAPLLVDYLNNGMVGSSLGFSLADGDSLWLSGSDYLNDGYAYFAWDLTDFNRANTSDVSLQSFSIPEPSTFILLLMTLVGAAWCRRTYQPQA